MPRSRSIAIAAGAALLLLLGAFAYDHSRRDTIADGVTIGGVDVSGLEARVATERLRERLERPLLRPVRVSYHGEVRKLTAGGAGVTVDVDGMVQEALERGGYGFFAVNAAAAVLGVDRGVAIPIRIDYDRTAIDNFVANVRKAYDRPARDAAVTYSARSLGETDGQIGVKVRTAKLRRELLATFRNPDAPRRIKLPVRIKRPKVTREDLAEKYPTVILVDRSGFKLRLYKRLKLVKTYRIAVGKVGLETPAGLYTINSKQVNPAWHVPNSEWAGDLAGKVIPGGAPNNPLIARWLGIYDGVGIHGTSSTSSIGSAASHGCIRMIPKDVIELYDRVPLGTPVYIG